MTTPAQVTNATALGQLARHARKSQGLTLKTLSGRAGLGIRFLSEFERGKETAELGKALSALHALGVNLTLTPGDDLAQDPVGDVSLIAQESSPLVAARDASAASRGAQTPVRVARPAAGGDVARVWDMVVAVSDIRGLMQFCDADPASHQSTAFKRAIERCFDVLGEAARRVTSQSQARFQRIPWRELITRRNGLVLNYEHVDHGALYRSALEDLPELEAELQAALAALESPAAG